MDSNKKAQVIFRCDASLEIGTGHVMRCLTLANALRLQGSVCRFVCKEFSGNLKNRIQQDGFEVVFLPPALAEIDKGQKESNLPKHFPWLGGSWQDDAEQTIAAIGSNKPSWLIVDHYGIDIRWEKVLRPHVEKIMVIDDLADREHDCDLLLDQNLVANIDQRYEGLLPEKSVRLLGPKYAILQPEYAELRKKAKVREGTVNRILIYFGGADIDNLSGMALEAFGSLQLNNILVDVVINPKSPHAEALKNQTKREKNITCHENLPSLAPLMINADLSIGAGGATSWERCCLGLPSIVVPISHNQIELTKYLSKINAIATLIPCKNEMEKNFRFFISSRSKKLKSMSLKSFSLVDGLGTNRLKQRMGI
jgi:UDP-2,4-diacetamido-2,4,6-trideoxy-beta-L-altropyranose hydrolase